MLVLTLEKNDVIPTFTHPVSSMAVMHAFVVILVSIALFESAPDVNAAARYKKEAVPPLSSEQYKEIETLHPDPAKPVDVHFTPTVIRADLTKTEVIESCGVPDVYQTVSNRVWRTYHYSLEISGVGSLKVPVNSPTVQSPQVRLSWRAIEELNRADFLNEGKLLVSRFNIVIPGRQNHRKCLANYTTAETAMV